MILDTPDTKKPIEIDFDVPKTAPPAKRIRVYLRCSDCGKKYPVVLEKGEVATVNGKCRKCFKKKRMG